jgi:curved DNA-binding protein CbpA
LATSGEAPTFYEVLGVSRDAGSEEIRRAYVAQARQLHPDTGSAAADPQAMQALNEAWRVLRDPARRAAYDLSLGIEPSPGATFEPITLEDFADLVGDDEEPPPPRAGDLVMLLPAGFLVGALGLMVFGAMSVNANVIGLAFGLLIVSGVSFLLAPFLTMARSRRQR